MPIRPDLLVRDAAGIPLPPVELVARIHQRIGAEWNLRYLAASWAVCRDWPEDDRRRAWIKDGTSDPAFAWDLIGHLPITCGLDEAPAFLEAMLRMDPREEIQKRATAIADWNQVEVPQQIADTLVNATRDEMGKNDEVTSAIFAVTPAAKATKRRPKFAGAVVTVPKAVK